MPEGSSDFLVVAADASAALGGVRSEASMILSSIKSVLDPCMLLVEIKR